MRHRSAVLLIAALLALPASTRAQGIGLGARVGTMGAGGELAVGLTERLFTRDTPEAYRLFARERVFRKAKQG